MMRRGRIQIVTTTCKRCNKPLAMTNRSIFGADEAKRKYERICRDCITEEERQEILNAQAQAILGHNK